MSSTFPLSPVGAIRLLARATTPLTLTLLLSLASPLAALHAQSSSDAHGDSWSFDAQYLHWNAGTMRRHATPSFEAAVGHDLRDARADGTAWRLEAGWLRAVRPTTTAQGATLGLSAGFGVPRLAGTVSNGARESSRLTIRPGLALLVGSAESQDSSAFYDWQGVAGTPASGTTGTEYTFSTTRGGTMGVGLSLGAELKLTQAFALTGSVQRWLFSGEVIAANRQVTLLGLGIAMRPSALLHRAEAQR